MRTSMYDMSASAENASHDRRPKNLLSNVLELGSRHAGTISMHDGSLEVQSTFTSSHQDAH